MALGTGLQALLQVFAQRQAMTKKEAEEVLKEIGREVAPGQSTDVESCVRRLNKMLKCMDLEIRGYHVRPGEQMFALINLTNDDVAKAEGKINEKEAAVFRDVLQALAEADFHTATLGELEAHRKKMTAAKFEKFVTDLCDDRWLSKKTPDCDDLVITFGPRAYTELADHLRHMGVDPPQQITLI
mmetsp:Transcript_2231/g.7469  ORF Transcript_2231/g.7469 Transcript_2231/m.7469 type:complete len:185 (-) Transcript_2231:69-623(-)